MGDTTHSSEWHNSSTFCDMTRSDRWHDSIIRIFYAHICAMAFFWDVRHGPFRLCDMAQSDSVTWLMYTWQGMHLKKFVKVSVSMCMHISIFLDLTCERLSIQVRESVCMYVYAHINIPRSYIRKTVHTSYMYMPVYARICMYVYAYLCVRICFECKRRSRHVICNCIRMHVYVHVCAYKCICYKWKHIPTCHMYVYMYACICTYKYMYIYVYMCV